MGIQLGNQAIDLGLITTNGEAMLAFYRSFAQQHSHLQ